MHRIRFLSVLSLLLWGLVLSPVAARAQTRRVALTATRSAAECAALTHYRANPLTIRLALDKSRPTATGWESITAEIRRNVTDTTPALASSSITGPTGPGPFEVTFTGAQTNQDLAGKQSAPFWLVIYALSGNGEVLDVLHAGKLTLLEHGASLTAAAPPNVVGVLSRPAADLLYRKLSESITLAELPLMDATAHAADQIDGAIQGLTASDSTKKVFTTENHAAGIYVRNENCWAASFDLTGLGVAWQSGGIWTTQLGFTAVTPRHVVMCHHSIIPDGSILRFVAANGAAVDRVLNASVRVGATDIRIGLLATALPSTIHPVALLPAGSLTLALATPALAIKQEHKALVVSLNNFAADATGFNAPSGARGLFYEVSAAGDSGYGVVVIFDGRPALLSHYSTPTAGPRVTASEVQSAADSLLPGSVVGTLFIARTVDWGAITGRPTITATAAPSVVPLTDNTGKIPGAFLPLGEATSIAWANITGIPWGPGTPSLANPYVSESYRPEDAGKLLRINTNGSLGVSSGTFGHTLSANGRAGYWGSACQFSAAGFSQAFAGVGAVTSTLDASGTAISLTFRQNGQAALGENPGTYMPRLTVAADGSLDWPGLAGATAKVTTRANLGLSPLATGAPTPDDIEVTNAAKGVILKSPGGARWRITVSDAGALSATAL